MSHTQQAAVWVGVSAEGVRRHKVGGGTRSPRRQPSWKCQGAWGTKTPAWKCQGPHFGRPVDRARFQGGKYTTGLAERVARREGPVQLDRARVHTRTHVAEYR